MCDGDSVSSGGLCPTNGGHNEVADDRPSPARRGRDVACGNEKSHMNASLSGVSAEQRGRPVECLVSNAPCGERALSLSVPDAHNRVTRVLSV